MRLSAILVGLSLMVLLSTGFLWVLSDGINVYSPSNIPSNFNASFDKLANLSTHLSASINTSDNQLSPNATDNRNAVSDFLGFYFGKAYQAGRTVVDSVTLSGTVLSEGVDLTIGQTPFGGLVKDVGLATIALLALMLLLAFVIKSDWI